MTYGLRFALIALGMMTAGCLNAVAITNNATATANNAVAITNNATANASGLAASAHNAAAAESEQEEVAEAGTLQADTTLVVDDLQLPNTIYLPLVFDTYSIYDADADTLALHRDIPVGWAERAALQAKRAARFKQQFMLANPWLVRYNMAWLPEPPKEYVMEVADPNQAKITVKEVKHDIREGLDEVKAATEIKRIYWLHTANGSVQFSQAYVSPNWYQGGNNNLNMLANALWNVKLNPAYHPNLMFETTVQYKLGLNSAPDDSLRYYSISDELFQVNMAFGVRAAKRWFYSVNVQFKTQFFNNYKSNTRTLKAALLSPGELNVGLGMTYNYTNPRKTLQLDAAISPLSYNMKTCINSDMDETAFGIREGHTTVSNYGSSAEATLKWQLTPNISLRSRLFAFTDYDYVQGDWENTFNFEINRFLSTQLYLHLRYDSSTPYHPDMRWQKWQFKEILSFGFAYKFATV